MHLLTWLRKSFTMKLWQSYCLSIVATITVYAQNRLPKNLKQSVHYFENNFEVGVKEQIRKSHPDSLTYTVYPFASSESGKRCKTIFNWTSDENGNPDIVKYLDKHGIYDFQSEVLVFAYRQYLEKGKIDEKSILRKYARIQKDSDTKNEVRFVADSINGVYIPKNIDDCIARINSFWPDSTKLAMKELPEKNFVAKLHFGFGMWMRNNWQLWGGSRLSKFFNDLGIHHPDDMSSIILTSYYRHITGVEIDMRGQIGYYQDYWKKAKADEAQKKISEFANYKIGSTVLFTYDEGFVSKSQEELYDNDICTGTGIVTERDEKNFLIKVKITETCDNKGLVYYDNEGSRIYNPKTKKFYNPEKRIIKKIKANRQLWCEYAKWEVAK